MFLMLHNATFKGIICLVGLLIFTTCKPSSDEGKQDKKPETTINIPSFNADSAYAFVEKQVSFGPRVVNTEAHVNCGDWMVNKFKSFGARVIEQEAQLEAYNGDILNARNIIASFAPEKKRRVLLCAHWDSRHVADYDPDPSKQKNPILGADDGGSGVAVLLEIARQLQQTPMDYMGVDIILFDAEDYGQPADGGGFPEVRDSWCLGSQYWGKNLHQAGYKANFGILLDMVGSKGARFTKDGTSRAFAQNVIDKVWREAQKSGFSSYFISENTNELIDDHLYVNKLTGIPTIDIINRPVQSTTGFGSYWHTHDDNMDVIDTATLNAVGQTVLNVIYKEAVGKLQ